MSGKDHMYICGCYSYFGWKMEGAHKIYNKCLLGVAWFFFVALFIALFDHSLIMLLSNNVKSSVILTP